ncbi:MAG: type II toxin-antitoxin system RelE/ParE family toxin [Muribaculaceae bacterium]|nr:type II toxin-antitoxin system RelE/ParE family toxin [Muribaculaceae bacterium]
MIVEFGEEYLQDLYTKGESNDKKHRYRSDVIKRYKRGIDYLKWASRKEDLFRINSLNFEALKGEKAGRFSIRVNNQYRIEFTLQENAEEPILTICNIVELSNHYD